MSNKRKAENLVDSDEVGGGGNFSEVQTISCRFHEFSNLPHKRGDKTLSRVLKCHGHEWQIMLFPGGSTTSKAEKVLTTIYLSLMSKTTDSLRVKFCIRAGEIDSAVNLANFEYQGHTWGYPNFALRADILNPSKGFLDDEGSLVVKADIQIFAKGRPVFKPPKKLHLDMLSLLESTDNADVIFSICGTKFPAHSAILKHRAPILASMAEGAPDGSEVVVSNVNPILFQELLRFIYGDELPSSEDMKKNARALLEASDRFGCSRMKLHLEAEVVSSVLSVENAADWVLFADSHNCALLKESAIALFTANSKAVMASPGWAAITESAEIMKELMQAMVRDTGAIDESDPKSMSVSTLRKKLDEKGLDVDGTREMLVERLEGAISNEEA